jgi:hypothetical protein
MMGAEPASVNARKATLREDSDRLICLAEALTLVPFSETTLRRAISSGELEAWQPHGEGKLVLWRSALIDWVTRRPAGDVRVPPQPAERRSGPAPLRRPRRGRAVKQRPEPITLTDLA